MLLVIVQFVCIGVLIVQPGPVTYNLLSLFTGGFSIVIGVWAVLVMAAGKLSIFIQRGPYRIIRHPMYLAVILFCLAEVLAYFTLFRLGVLIFLIVDLLIKMRYEESLLVQEFEEYRSYKKVTRKIVPFVY